MSTSRPNEHLVTSLNIKNISTDDFPKKFEHSENHFVTIEDENVKGMQIASFSANGTKKPSNEDYMNINFLSDTGFEKLTPEVRRLVIQSWGTQVQNKFKEENKNQTVGTTACMTFTWTDEKQTIHNLTANLGDSHADVYRISKDQNNLHTLISSERLGELHKPDEEKERKRIEDEWGRVEYGRVLGELSLSRAWGDFDLVPLISDTVTFSKESSYSLESNENIIFFIACDGTDTMMDKKKDEFETKLLENMSIDKLAMNLVTHSLTTDARDNTSGILLNLQAPKSKDKPISPLFAAVYDGHGGIDFAKFVSEKGLEMLKGKISLASTIEGQNKLKKEEEKRQAEIALRLQKKAHFKNVLENILKPIMPISSTLYNAYRLEYCAVYFFYGENNPEKIKKIYREKIKKILANEKYFPIQKLITEYQEFQIKFNLNEVIPPVLIDFIAEMNATFPLSDQEIEELEDYKRISHQDIAEYKNIRDQGKEKYKKISDQEKEEYKKMLLFCPKIQDQSSVLDSDCPGEIINKQQEEILLKSDIAIQDSKISSDPGMVVQDIMTPAI
jgi:serine/threonine protein phosphatase PrpC